MIGPISGLTWASVIMAVAAIAVGCAAQAWHSRTGTAWACASYILMMVLFVLIYSVFELVEPKVYGHDAAWIMCAIMAAGIGGGIGTIAVAALPRRE